MWLEVKACSSWRKAGEGRLSLGVNGTMSFSGATDRMVEDCFLGAENSSILGSGLLGSAITQKQSEGDRRGTEARRRYRRRGRQMPGERG